MGSALRFLPHKWGACQRPGARRQPAPQSGEPTSAFCTRSLRWVPSQYGAFWVALQVQRATVRVSWALNLSGDRPVRWKKWEPSQKGW